MTHKLITCELIKHQLAAGACGWSVSLLSIHHPPETMLCVSSKYTSFSKNTRNYVLWLLKISVAGWCLYCQYTMATILQKLCYVSLLNTPAFLKTPVSESQVLSSKQLDVRCLYCPNTILQKL